MMSTTRPRRPAITCCVDGATGSTWSHRRERAGSKRATPRGTSSATRRRGQRPPAKAPPSLLRASISYYNRNMKFADERGRRRVVVTGLGLITPCGADKDTTWRALLEGKSGIRPITSFDTAGFKTTIAGEARDFDVSRTLE